jgi:hypothetical protein
MHDISVISFCCGILTLLKINFSGHQWLMPVILATLEAEIRRSRFEASPSSRLYFQTTQQKTGLEK